MSLLELRPLPPTPPVFITKNSTPLHPNFTTPHEMAGLPWWCDFGEPANEDTCDMMSDRSVTLQFVANVGGTWTKGTGPPSSGFKQHGW